MPGPGSTPTVADTDAPIQFNLGPTIVRTISGPTGCEVAFRAHAAHCVSPAGWQAGHATNGEDGSWTAGPPLVGTSLDQASISPT
jgi:hypothetical protein